MALKPETIDQIKVFDWIRLHKQLRFCSFHIPNEGKRSVSMGALLKRMGMRAGVSDIFIAYPKNGKSGLFIELKAKTSSGIYNKATATQLQFIDDMLAMGYDAVVCNGADCAIDKIKNYLQRT